MPIVLIGIALVLTFITYDGTRLFLRTLSKERQIDIVQDFALHYGPIALFLIVFPLLLLAFPSLFRLISSWPFGEEIIFYGWPMVTMVFMGMSFNLYHYKKHIKDAYIKYLPFFSFLLTVVSMAWVFFVMMMYSILSDLF